MSRRGSVLLYVVWVIALLSLLAAGLGTRGVFALGVLDRLDEGLRASCAAASCVDFAVIAARDDPTPDLDGRREAWWHLEAWEPMRPPGVTVRFGQGMTDEDSKINLNSAPVEVLENLLTMTGAPELGSRQIAAAIVDWRDDDTDESELGAERSYYLGLPDAYECKDGPFETVEELLLVRGMTLERWVKVAPYVTVYGSERLNVNTAAPETLGALGLSDLGVEEIELYLAGEDSVRDTDDDRVFHSANQLIVELEASMPTEDAAILSELIRGGFLGVASEAFRLSVQASVDGSLNQIRVTCVFHRNGQILSWTEG